MFTSQVQIPLRPVDSLGYPIREKHAGKLPADIRAEAHQTLADAANERQRAQELSGEVERIQQAIYDHELSRLNRELAQARRLRDESEARAEAGERRGTGALRLHQDPAIVRSKKALLDLLHNVREGRTDIVDGSGSKRLKRDVAIRRIDTALAELERLVLTDYGASATQQLTAILTPCGLTIPPSEEQRQAAAERLAAKEREIA